MCKSVTTCIKCSRLRLDRTFVLILLLYIFFIVCNSNKFGFVKKDETIQNVSNYHVTNVKGNRTENRNSANNKTELTEEIFNYQRGVFQNAIFVGHMANDLDSVASAIGAAELYGGIPVLASDINSETSFALDKWNVTTPARIESVLLTTASNNSSKKKIFLVDHQQTSQMHPSINADNIIGVIDHHALQSKTIVTDKPIHIDIRPFGSMSTIIAMTFLTHDRRPPVHVAGMLLGAIISDTLNLLGPTTTETDRLMVDILADIAGVENIQVLAQEQFKAKSQELLTVSAIDLISSDCKSFSFENTPFNGTIGFAVIETTDTDVIMNHDHIGDLNLIQTMITYKQEKSYKCFFLAIVNIVKLQSYLLLHSPIEIKLAIDAFGIDTDFGYHKMHDKNNNTLVIVDLGKRVSRKTDFIPPLARIIMKNGWSEEKM